MKINPEKLARQLRFLARWKANKAQGSLEACTGFGKTYCAVLAIQDMNDRFPERTTLVVVPTRYLSSQWKNEVINHGLKNVTVLVVNTAIKKNGDYDLLVLDEIHNYAAEKFSNVFKCIKYSFVMGLTATLERSDKKHHQLSRIAPVIDTVTVEQAVQAGYVSKFTIYNLGVNLNTEERAEYQKINDRFYKYFSLFNFDFNGAMRALTDKEYRKQLAKMMNWEDKEVMIFALAFNKNMRLRKTFLFNNKTKIELTKQILERYPDSKAITFAESVDFADLLTEAIGDTSFSYHTKVPKKKREALMKMYTDDLSKVRVINTAKALDEGFNVEGIELAIICSGSSSPRQDLQRTGRAIRFVEGKEAVVVNLYIKDSQDEKWLRKRQAKNTNIVWINSIKQLGDEKETIEAPIERTPENGGFNLFYGDK
jgi:superfamily II DNA or RNA helicase